MQAAQLGGELFILLPFIVSNKTKTIIIFTSVLTYDKSV
jgi:hypothetical protein